MRRRVSMRRGEEEEEEGEDGGGGCRLLNPFFFSLIRWGEQSRSEQQQQAADRQTAGELSLSPPLFGSPYLFSPYSPLSLSPSPLPVSSDKSLTHRLFFFFSTSPVSPHLSSPLPRLHPSRLSPLPPFCFIFLFLPSRLTSSLTSSLPLSPRLAQSPPAGLFSRLSSAVAAVFAESAVFFQMTQILAVGENLIRALIAFFSPPSVSPPFFMRADVYTNTHFLLISKS